MNLKAFVTEHASRLKVLRPLPPRALGVPMLVPSRSQRYSLIGTAFDYLLRFELQRGAPHAVGSRWAAQVSLERLFRQVRQADGTLRSLIPDDQLAVMTPLVAGDTLDDLDEHISLGREGNVEVAIFTGRKPGERYHPSMDVAQRVGRRAYKIVEDARSCVEQNATPAELARCSLRLAWIDIVLRAGRVEPAMLAEPEADDVAELLDLLGVVPFEALVNRERMILNPSFGQASRRIGGADCDLLAGDLLVDFKATKQSSMEVLWLDQLLGYYLLSRLDPNTPPIGRLGIYFVRHGYLWERPVSLWTEHPQFAEVEEWFRQGLNR